MRIASLIARFLLSLVFLVFGLNGFLQFIPMGPLPTGVAGQFVSALMASHYALVVSAFQLAGAILLLMNRFVPLGLTILAPVIVNIFLFHALMAPAGLPLAILVSVLWLLAAYPVRYNFAGLFQPGIPSQRSEIRH